MPKTFSTLKEARKELAKHSECSGVKIWNKKLQKHRSKAQKARIKKPYYVGTYLEWLNL